VLDEIDQAQVDRASTGFRGARFGRRLQRGQTPFDVARRILYRRDRRDVRALGPLLPQRDLLACRLA
jgi:hypothetical protein